MKREIQPRDDGSRYFSHKGGVTCKRLKAQLTWYVVRSQHTVVVQLESEAETARKPQQWGSASFKTLPASVCWENIAL